MSVRIDVLLWAQRVIARRGAPAHEVLEIAPNAGLQDAQDAFHEIARKGHPDLHRRALNRDELELVELAYSRAAGAYHDFRTQHAQSLRAAAQTGSAAPPGRTRPPTGTAEAVSPQSEPAGSPRAPAPMNGKATLYYRKAELCLRRGDLKGALLQMKLAIAGDPQSSFLRSALAELEAELSR